MIDTRDIRAATVLLLPAHNCYLLFFENGVGAPYPGLTRSSDNINLACSIYLKGAGYKAVRQGWWRARLGSGGFYTLPNFLDILPFMLFRNMLYMVMKFWFTPSEPWAAECRRERRLGAGAMVGGVSEQAALWGERKDGGGRDRSLKGSQTLC